MLVSDIIARVKHQFGDEAGAQVSDENIITWINDAMVDIAINNNLLQMKGTTPLFANQEGYDLPPELLTLRTVKYNGRKLMPRSMEEMDNAAVLEPPLANGDPISYYLFAGQINLYPVPGTDQAGNQLSLYYTRVPVTVTLPTDTPELPQQYHPRIVEYCIGQAAESDDNLQHYQLKMSQYKQGIDDLRDNVDWEERDFYPSITVSSRDTDSWSIGYTY